MSAAPNQEAVIVVAPMAATAAAAAGTDAPASVAHPDQPSATAANAILKQPEMFPARPHVLTAHPSSSMDEGNIPLSIAYKNLSWEVDVPNNDPATKKLKPTIAKKVISNVSGTFRPGRLTAVMGASGAGKTTLLNLIAGYAVGGRTSGDILVNGEPIGTAFMRELSAFVHQADVILESMTVREAVTMAAHLRLPRSLSNELKQSRIDEVMRWLSLVKVADNMIGSPEKKGISGGERRRVSVAMELVRNPGIMFLDEPTSGLDSFTAYAVAHLLRTVAHVHRRTIVATIHQPSSEIFHLFDDLCLLSAGRVIYHGPASEAMTYFDVNLNYKIPRYTNPADYIFMSILNADSKKIAIGAVKKTTHQQQLMLDSPSSVQPGTLPSPAARGSEETAEGAAALWKVASTLQTTGSNGEAKKSLESEQVGDEQREQRIIAMWNEPSAKGELPTHRRQLDADVEVQSLKRRLPNRTDMAAEVATFATQFYFLCLRAFNDVRRNPYKMRARLGQCLFMSLFAGLCYLQVGDGQSSVQNRRGVLFFLCASGMMSSTMGTLTIFVPEKAVFTREYASRMYGLPAFFFSKFMMELPMRIFFPLLLSAIMYWMVGLKSDAATFWTLAGTLVLLDVCGSGMGVMMASLFSTMQVALAATPMLVLPLMIFSGFFMNSNSIPNWLDWISYLSPIKYAFRSLALNEFPGLEFTCSEGESCTYRTGEQVLAQLNFNTGMGISESEGLLLTLAAGFFILGYLALWRASRTL